MRIAEIEEGAPVVLVATQGQGDEAALESALRSPARQVLMIASRRKAEKLREAMSARGITEDQLARLQAPAGPDAGAKSPAEIAMVAMVGVLAILRDRARHEAKPKAAGTFVNPVCGAPIDMATAIHVERHEGIDYYFCCDGCWTMFRQEPAKYAAIHRASTAKTPA
jgi:xanthine dehydrogenase accessory factor